MGQKDGVFLCSFVANDNNNHHHHRSLKITLPIDFAYAKPYVDVLCLCLSYVTCLTSFLCALLSILLFLCFRRRIWPFALMKGKLLKS